jgi:hypothetical protein
MLGKAEAATAAPKLAAQHLLDANDPAQKAAQDAIVKFSTAVGEAANKLKSLTDIGGLNRTDHKSPVRIP